MRRQTRTKHNSRDEQDGADDARGRASAAGFFVALHPGPRIHLLYRDNAGVLLLHHVCEEHQRCVSMAPSARCRCDHLR